MPRQRTEVRKIRQSLQHHFEDGYSDRYIAELSGISHPTVKKIRMRVLEADTHGRFPMSWMMWPLSSSVSVQCRATSALDRFRTGAMSGLRCRGRGQPFFWSGRDTVTTIPRDWNTAGSVSCTGTGGARGRYPCTRVTMPVRRPSLTMQG